MSSSAQGEAVDTSASGSILDQYEILFFGGGVVSKEGVVEGRPRTWRTPHTVHLPLGALLSPCTACGTGRGRDCERRGRLLQGR